MKFFMPKNVFRPRDRNGRFAKKVNYVFSSDKDRIAILEKRIENLAKLQNNMGHDIRPMYNEWLHKRRKSGHHIHEINMFNLSRWNCKCGAIFMYDQWWIPEVKNG